MEWVKKEDAWNYIQNYTYLAGLKLLLYYIHSWDADKRSLYTCLPLNLFSSCWI